MSHQEIHIHLDLCGVEPAKMERFIDAATKALRAYTDNRGVQAEVDRQASNLDTTVKPLEEAVKNANQPPKG